MGYISPNNSFYNAQNAFVMAYDAITRFGHTKKDGTRAIFNFGFYITNPVDNTINVEWRKWSKQYAEREWNWYLSKNRSVETIKKYAPIWDTMHNGDNIVNSNYGHLWNEDDQLQKCINQLWNKEESRQAWLTLFDGKKKSEYEHDTPCTLNIGFTVHNNTLCMNVNMRSNDLWYGFCNDQYCFSMLQQYVAGQLDLDVGWYYHFAADLHLYQRNQGMQESFYKTIKL